MSNLGSKAILLFLLLSAEVPAAFSATLFSDAFNRPDGLITNEYAFWSPSDPAAVVSPDWQLDSGSFFVQGNTAWSGVPDDCSNGASSPNARSSNCTDSAIFRLTTKRFDFNNVKVSFSLLSNGLSSTSSTPPVAWDGIHIFLRYQSEFNLYYASINRREQTSVIKKKCPGGTDNGGTYYELTPYVTHAWSPGSWQHISATVQTNPDQSVTIALYDDNGLVVQGTDNNVGKCAPITAAGAVGIRGDNNNFKLDDFLVTDASSTATTPPPPVTPPSVTLPSSASHDLSSIRVFPNPWRIDKHTAEGVTFGQLTDTVRIRVFTISGRLVKDLGNVMSAAKWDLTNDSGDRVASGIYVYLVTNSLGQQARGKLAVIR